MQRIAVIGSLLKKIYRLYSQELLISLQERGFLDLRPSFLEILTFVCEVESPSIKEIGHACGLKKQTMTSHLNELERRGYIIRKKGLKDKREQNVILTEYGEKFKVSLLEVISDLEGKYMNMIGDVEFDRVTHTLENFFTKINNTDDQQRLI